MKTRGNNRKKINIVTLGCSKNLVDSEVLLTQLRGNGLKAIHESNRDDCEVIIINTCGFVEKAKQESINTILRYADAKQNGQIRKLYVTGCLSQRYREELEKEIPEVDAFFGTHELPQLLKKFNADYRHDLLGERITTTASHFAYLKISEGCDRPCSFCAIPLMRGKHVSRPIEELVMEGRKLASRGVREIILIAQDSTYYGLDLYRERRLHPLLQQISEIDGIEWIRLHYAYPSGFPMEIIGEIAKNSKICKYLDIPLQHASDHMLKVMRRGTNREKTEALINTIRDKIPAIAIRTTMIVGHPGETENDFEQLVRFTEKMKFDRMGVFTYSHEENTHSFTLKDEVPEYIKRERADTLMALQESISHESNLNKVGKTFKVLFDRTEGGFHVGRTEFDSPEVDNEVLVKGEFRGIRPGDFNDILITEALPFDLIGKPSSIIN